MRNRIIKIIFWVLAILLIPSNIDLDYYPSEIKFYNITVKIPNGYKLKFVTAKSVYMYPGIYNYILYSKLFLEKKANHQKITLHFINNKGYYVVLIFKKSLKKFGDSQKTIETIKNKNKKLYVIEAAMKECYYKNITLLSNSYNILNLFAKNIKCDN